MLGSIRETIDYQHQQLLQFEDTHPDVWEIIDGFIISARALITDCLRYSGDSIRNTTLHTLWHTVYEYQEDSLLLLIASRTDAGYGLLRMVAEFARDAARISENDLNYEMWQKRQEIKREKNYKKVFRFNDDNQEEKYVHSIYDLGSDYGIHGHQTSQMFMSKSDLTEDGRFVSIRSTDLEVLEILTVWLFSFFPLQNLVSRGFHERLGRDKSQAYRAFLNLQVVSGDALRIYAGKVKELKTTSTKTTKD